MRRRKRNRWIVPVAGVTGGLGVTALGLYGARQLWKSTDGRHSPTTANRLATTTRTIVVNREIGDVYGFWSNFESFPRFMRHLKQVSVRKDGRSHWKAYGPGGLLYEWDAEVVQTRPDELIAWRSLPGADVENEGSVRFERAPGGRGTLVRVNLRYSPPAGAAGRAVAMLLGREPGQEVQEDLRRFKQVIETGEVVLSDANVHGGPHPARPPEDPYRLPTPVAGAGPVRSAMRDDVPAQPAGRAGTPEGDSWPDPDDRPARRSEVDDAAVIAARGGDR
jgi:uncharacterized membrane protein